MDRWNWNDGYPHGREPHLDNYRHNKQRREMARENKAETWRRSGHRHISAGRGTERCKCHECRVQEVIELCAELDIPILTPEEAIVQGLDLDVDSDS